MRSLKESLGPLLVELSKKGVHRPLGAMWEDVVGALVARHTHPVRLEAGVLTIRCDGAMWKQAVAAQHEAVLERVRARLGEGAVRELAFEL